MRAFKKFVLIGAAAMAVASSAHADDFNFQFTSGSSPLVRGTIYGLTDNATSFPTSIFVTSGGFSETIPTPTPPNYVGTANSGPTMGTDPFFYSTYAGTGFTEDDGVITAVNYQWEQPIPLPILEIAFDFGADVAGGQNYLIAHYPDIFSSDGFDGVTYSLVSPTAGVPEPAAWALLVLGFSGIGVAFRVRRRRAIVSA